MRIEITRVESAFDGLCFGNVGAYEKVAGRIFADVDPAHPLNAGIINIEKAPSNGIGRVEYQLDFYLLKPVDLRSGNRRIFYDVVNRGNKLALNNLNDAPRTNDPAAAADAGNGFLMRQGYSLLWSGWQGGLSEGDHLLRAQLPVATEQDAPIVATSRDEFILEHTHNPITLSLSYPASTLDQGAATLTVRQREPDRRIALSPKDWRFKSNTRIEINRPVGFDAGAIYEFIYPARDPVVMGLGFAAVRDVVAFMRHDRADANGTSNPLMQDGQPGINYVLAYGASQSGRFCAILSGRGSIRTCTAARCLTECSRPSPGHARPLSILPSRSLGGFPASTKTASFRMISSRFVMPLLPTL